MQAVELVNGVHWVGAIDWNRSIFDELMPLPDGTSYNAYLVQGSEKTALIETVEEDFSHELFGRLESLGVSRIDYIIANHAEQDHSGSLPLVMQRYPEAQLITSKKGVAALSDLLQLDASRMQAVADGDTLDLGGRTLEFIDFPWVHWPETMLTFLKEDRVLFPCDLFGSHFATAEMKQELNGRLYNALKLYYAQIMMPFRKVIEKNLVKVTERKPVMIAPSHGPVHTNPDSIISLYQQWVGDQVQNRVVLPYVSMHGSTSHLVNALIEALMAREIPVEPFNLTHADTGKLAAALVDAATIVIGSPTVLGGPHPMVSYACILANLLKPKTRFAGIIGSYGWAGHLVKDIQALIPKLKVELFEPVLCKGLPNDDAYTAIEQLADTIAEKHRSL